MTSFGDNISAITDHYKTISGYIAGYWTDWHAHNATIQEQTVKLQQLRREFLDLLAYPSQDVSQYVTELRIQGQLRQIKHTKDVIAWHQERMVWCVERIHYWEATRVTWVDRLKTYTC